MNKILFLYSTVDGHTLKICRRLQQLLEQAGHRVTLAPLGPDIELEPFDTIVVGASIRYGKHRPEVARFMRAKRAILERRPSAFFSVNIVARKPNKNTPEVAVFAGMLDYPRYGFWDRQVIRFIMLLTKGPTDPTSVVEFTDWNQVEDFGRRIGEMR
jgi:menaquinone-dependent protoporphyrinogen oxidase